VAENILDLIHKATKKPYKRMYIKRRNSAGEYESTWQRIDSKDGIARVNSWGTIEYSIDAEKVIVNTWDISQLKNSFSNYDGWFNSSLDDRSFWFGYLDHKDTKLKVDIGLYDRDDTVVGEITIFEGLIVNAENTSDLISSISTADYSKKLNEISFQDFGLEGQTLSASEIIDAIFTDSTVTMFFSSYVNSPKKDYDLLIDSDVNDIFLESAWQVLQYLAKISSSTISVVNDEFNFIGRDYIFSSSLAVDSNGALAVDSEGVLAYAETTQSNADVTIYGTGSNSPYGNLTLYGSAIYDKGGSDKLYTTIVETSTGSKVQSLAPSLLIEGRTKEIDLTDIVSDADKTEIITEYLSRFGVKRPTISLNCSNYMGLLYPFNKFSVDNTGRQKVADDVLIWGVSYWEGSDVWGVRTGANKVYPSEVFNIEKVSYDLDVWATNIFGRSVSSL